VFCVSLAIYAEAENDNMYKREETETCTSCLDQTRNRVAGVQSTVNLEEKKQSASRIMIRQILCFGSEIVRRP